VKDYPVYTNEVQYKKLLDKARKALERCKDTVKETLQLEDYEEEGFVTAEAFRESLAGLDEFDSDMLDFLLYLVYTKSPSADRLRYPALFELFNDKSLMGPSTDSRRRPESSSPEKLKARNKEKVEENYEEEEFEKMLDKGDEEEEEEEVIDEEQMLDIAEKCFVRIAEAIISRSQSVREAFRKHIVVEAGQELLSPMGFLEGVKALGIGDLEEIDVACLMRILTKPDIENAILLQELVIIMENFGITEDAPVHQEQETPTRAAKQRKNEAFDLQSMDEKSIKILAKLMLALMELNVSLQEFFEGVIFEQLVKTKAGKAGASARKVEIIDSKDFFDYLQARGVRKSAAPHPPLKRILQLDPNYPELILVKKLAKAIDEIAKNEELMEGIMAAAEDEGRLVTIGEEDDKQGAT
jgi:hypothetical protein